MSFKSLITGGKKLKPVFEILQGKLKINKYALPSELHFRSIVSLLHDHPSHVTVLPIKSFHTGSANYRRKNPDEVEEFDEIKSIMYNREFERKEYKDKASFLEVVRLYKSNVKTTTGHVDFIKAALKQMRAFGVHEDLFAYKKLLDVLPKGKYVATNIWLAEFMYFPRQQFVTLELLEQMEMNGVEPDKELLVLIEKIFGRLSHPYKRVGTTLYWNIKLKNKSPFYSPKVLPDDALLLAKIAIERMTRVDLETKISVYNTESVTESTDKTWIVSGQSSKQKELLSKHPKTQPVIVEGGDLVWLRDKPVSYFILKADGEPFPVYIEDKDDITDMESMIFNPNYKEIEKEERSVHEQDDGIIYGICATGTSSRDSLLSWVRILQSAGNPILEDVPVLFRLKTPETSPVPFSDELVQQEQKDSTENKTNN